eukprot:gene26924-33573_t
MSHQLNLKDSNKTTFLTSDTIGVSDIALASLFAPLVYPPEYCSGKYTYIFDKMQAQDAVALEDMLYYRNTVTG